MGFYVKGYLLDIGVRQWPLVHGVVGDGGGVEQRRPGGMSRPAEGSGVGGGKEEQLHG